MSINNNPTAPTHPTIIQWEIDYRLPEINGTLKQNKFARDIRFNRLYPILKTLLELADCFPSNDRPFLFQTINNLRAEIDPAFWINLHQNDIELTEFIVKTIELTHAELEHEELINWLEN